MSKTVIVAGAGASLAQAESLRPVKSSRHPPLDGNFFSSAERLARRDAEIRQYVQLLTRSVGSSDQFYDPFQFHEISLEQFFADVYYEVVAARTEVAFAVYLQLLHMYNTVLSTTTNWMAEHARLGDLDRLLRLELKRTPDVTIVTFNQDLVLENIIQRLPRHQGQWCLSSLYGIDDLQALFAPSGPTFTHHNPNCPHTPPVKLLKLHGSLNWGFRSLKAEPTVRSLFPTGKKELFVHNSRASHDSTKMKTRTPRGRKTWYLWPLVIPPIYDKSKISAMPVLKKVWNDARAAIESADRLVLVGYSLPDADVFARQMLRMAFTSNQTLDAVECINPDPALAGKLKAKLDCRVFRLYHDVPTYIEHNQP